MDEKLEIDLHTRLLQLNPGRRIASPDGCAWGDLYLPAEDESQPKAASGLRVVLMGSWLGGELAFAAISKLEKECPEALQLVGVVTDDPLAPDARISAKKRFWKFYQPEKQEKYELWLIDSILSFGVPCFTGEVKSSAFRALLSQWKPDVILVCVFGQRLDKKILTYPRYGIYNIHPSDLLHGHGAGAEPWVDLVARNDTMTRTAIHVMSEEIDMGAVVGESPPICVATPDGKLTSDIPIILEKGMSPVMAMVRALLSKLIENKEKGLTGAITSMNFEDIFSDEEKRKMGSCLEPEF